MRVINFFAYVIIAWASVPALLADTALSPTDKVLRSAAQLMELSNLSYVFGGHQLGSETDCETCSSCLEAAKPAPKQRLQKCPTCERCSLDCSHFTHLVFKMAGIEIPYLHTDLMVSLSREALLKRYRLVDMGRDVKVIQPGDLLVYHGHVVMVERLGAVPDRVDVVHATSGRDIKIPGQGIQRERQAIASQFRGPLQRILRHSAFLAPDRPLTKRLRPVARRQEGPPQGD